MKKRLKILIILFCCIALCGCRKAKEADAPLLNDWQIGLLEAEGLPTDYDILTSRQQNTITRIWEMISYLDEKYEEEFIYVKYIPKDLNRSETLIAYPRSTGAGDGKYYVTVRTKGENFTDDHSDFSVTDLAEELTNEFLTEHFGGSYKYFISPLACDITMAEMEDCKFQWKYGAENRIFLLEDLCSIDDVEEFAVEYAKFLYEHELSGTHRIEIITEFPKDESKWTGQGGKLYGNKDGLSTGFYVLSSNSYHHEPTVFRTDHIKYDTDADRFNEIEFDIIKEYSVEDYFSKIK